MNSVSDVGHSLDVGYAVAISQAESVVVEVITHPPDAPSSHGILAGVDKRDTPRLARRAVYFNPVGRKVHREIGVGVAVKLGVPPSPTAIEIV